MLVAALGLGCAAAGYFLWSPYPTTERRFDQGRNGLWLGHRWLTGREVRTGKPVAEADRNQLLQTLGSHGIRWAFVHAGPIKSDGSVADLPGEYLAELVRLSPPGVRFLPWLGALSHHLAMGNPQWRQSFLRTLQAWRDAGFAGVHLDIEPLRDEHPGYSELLMEIRAHFGPDYVISHATRRAGPYGWTAGPLHENFWSERYYRELMELTDQTVLMAYDTTFSREKLYVGFVGHQAGLLLDWACALPRHQVLIGIPSFEDAPAVSIPRVENLRSASLGVRAALERRNPARCFEGVAVYAEWVTDASEWQDYRRFWMDGNEGPGR